MSTNPLPTDPAALRAAFEAVIGRSPFTAWMGTSIEAIEPGQVTIRAPLRPEHRQHHGQAHGAVLAYMADTAVSWAAATVVGDVVTSEFKINLLAPARGQALSARGEVLRAGRRQAVVRADVWAHDGERREHVATCLATIAVLQAPVPA
ncbi:PaaI family thioesterase [Rivibacter subsaxonicus]|uniref:Medium/long-chain acyl-CoA thioesterase YigI n=1 Tax=Rivibacter subsaxonicus TaxID=457575 RepID=A0A4Q7VA53_9BURK|nr:PaaI family thioesterase [Rivibacter subsaxonicus]RZT93631.1 uncharacterized protein (TIGR00369 family) [Rivibacter subsaxonicus]